MAITSTTLSLAIDNHQTTFRVASVTGMNVPIGSTGQRTYLYMDEELMQVEALPFSGSVQATRGIQGTQATTHAAGATILVGSASDFPAFSAGVSFTYDTGTNEWFPLQYKSSTVAPALSATVPAAATLACSGTLFHVSGTTALNIISPPVPFSDNSVTLICDGALTWTSSAVAGGIAMSGAVTSAGEAVTFFYDPVAALWYADRRA